MKLYKVIGGVATVNEQIEINAAQLKPRRHNVEAVRQMGADRYRVTPTAPLQFKIGEVIGLDGLSKHLTDILVPIEAPEGAAEQQAVKAAAERRAKADADAAAKARAEAEAKRKKQRRR